MPKNEKEPARTAAGSADSLRTAAMTPGLGSGVVQFSRWSGRWLACLVLSGQAAVAPAHTLDGQSLGTAATAEDKFSITCSEDGHGAPHHLVVQLRDDAPVAPPVLIAVISKSGSRVELRTEQASDGTGRSSPPVSLAGGPGAYQLSVGKNAAGPERYSLGYHCENAGKLHVGTSISIRQNQ